MSPREQETAYINGFRPASVPLQSPAVNHMAKVKSSKIVQYVCAISRLRKRIAQSRDCTNVLHNLKIVCEIGMQFRDSERNLEIAQIPKLRVTRTYIHYFQYHDITKHGHLESNMHYPFMCTRQLPTCIPVDTVLGHARLLHFTLHTGRHCPWSRQTPPFHPACQLCIRLYVCVCVCVGMCVCVSVWVNVCMCECVMVHCVCACAYVYRPHV